MKNITSFHPVVFAVAIGCLVMVSGCLTKQPLVTYTPVVLTTTNPATGATVTVTNTLTNTAAIYVVPTNAIQAVSGTLQTVNALTAPVDPASPLLTTIIPWGTAGVLAVLTGVATFLNNKKNGVLSAIIQGVESAAPNGSDSSPTTVAAVKASVASKAALSGVTEDVQKAVQANT